MNEEDFNKALERFSLKRKFETTLFYGVVTCLGVLCFLQFKGILLSTFGVTTILLINIISIINISSRSSHLYKSLSDFYRLKVPSYAPLQSPALKMSADMERDIGQPLRKEIKLNSTLLYSVGLMALVCSLIVMVDAYNGQFRIYQFSQWVNNSIYFGYFALVMVLYRVMFLSEKRIGKLQKQFIKYMGELDKLRVRPKEY